MKKRAELNFAKYSDRQLIDMVTGINEIRGNDGKKIGTEAFANYYHVDFNYGQATYELEKRGFKQLWCKVTETNSVTEINLSEVKRTNLRRYQATYSETFIKKLQALVSEIQKNDKKSLALEMILESEIDKLLQEKKQGKLRVKDVQKKVIESENYIY